VSSQARKARKKRRALDRYARNSHAADFDTRCFILSEDTQNISEIVARFRDFSPKIARLIFVYFQYLAKKC